MHFDWKTLTFSMDGAQLNNLSALPSKLLEVIKDPQSNIAAALILLAIAILFVIIIILGIISWFGRSKGIVLVESTMYETDELDEDGIPVVEVYEREIQVPKDPMKRYYAFLSFVVIFFVMWIVTGVTTQANFVCSTCHGESAHVKQIEKGAHKGVNCVRCHESGGGLGTVTTAVPARLAHFVTGTFSPKNTIGYQSYRGGSCSNCHDNLKKDGVQVNKAISIRMSHKEPLAAGMSCLACHELDRNRDITNATANMQSCLNCHDGTKAKTDCKVCHIGNVVARSATGPSKDNAQALVTRNPNQSCYSCHNPQPCDSCHGLRMPHPANYESRHPTDILLHGRATCNKCHDKTDCAQCHTGEEGF